MINYEPRYQGRHPPKQGKLIILHYADMTTEEEWLFVYEHS